jgi:hypothetical protein
MRYLVLAAALCCTFPGFSQLFPTTDNPHGYFRDPLGIPMSLAANFGELRPNHYHMGLDIRTQHRENLPVYAAADGYVSRVSVEPGGFGQAIYINHPNGYTTVYGHLNRFFPALAVYVREQQYRHESWQLGLQLTPSQFPVKKGDLIAYSGNTGGSQGPHLHFEIRRTAGDVNQNPLLFGLPIPDNTPPTLQRLAWYDRDKGIYEQKPHILPISHSTITPALLIVPTTRISFALSAFDTQSGSSNPNGIYEAGLYVDEQPVIGFQMNNISYDYTRNINAHIDYRTRATGGPFLQQLFFLSGYPAPSIYSWPVARRSDGVVRLEDGQAHAIRIVVRDTYGNESNLRFRVQYRPGVEAPVERTEGKKFYAGMVDGVETPDYAFFLGEKSLYDSVTISSGMAGPPGSGLSLPGGVSAVQAIGSPSIPLLDPVMVRLRPDPSAGAAPVNTDRIVMVCFSGASRDVVRPEWKDGWASARFREFGNFQLVRDSEPPVISFQGFANGANLSKARRLVVSVKDNLGAWRGFRAELDPPADGGPGKWLCFTNDKGLAYIYPFDDKCPAGKHVLRVTVQDVAGNIATKEMRFTR